MNWLEETRFELKKDLQAAAEAARTSGELSFEQLPDFVIERPRDKAHGDFAANLAMLLARQAKMAPRFTWKRWRLPARALSIFI